MEFNIFAGVVIIKLTASLNVLDEENTASRPKNRRTIIDNIKLKYSRLRHLNINLIRSVDAV